MRILPIPIALLMPVFAFMTGKGSGPGSPADYSVAGHVASEVVDDIAQWVEKNGSPGK